MKKRILILLALLCAFAQGALADKWDGNTFIKPQYLSDLSGSYYHITNGDYSDVYTIADLNGLEGPEETRDPWFNPGGAFNAPTDGSGTYMLGDVLKDQDGNRWICILGSPYSTHTSAFCTDRRATFVSFEFNGIDTSGDKIPGLPNEAEAIKVGGQFIAMIMGLRNIKGKGHLDMSQGGSIGVPLNHMRLYADWDIRKAVIALDSTWTFTAWKDGKVEKTYDSKSSNTIFNIAYDDGTPGKQALLRMYRYYESYDPSRMTRLFIKSPYNHSGPSITPWHQLFPSTLIMRFIRCLNWTSRH